MNTLSLPANPATAPIPLPPQFTRLVLTGFMGAGKSTVGRLLADHLGWTFLDLDTLVEDLAGLSIPEIFRTLGEAALRRLESRALVRALRQPHTVLALGGGAPETLTNRLLLEQTSGIAVIFLDAAFPILFDRCLLQALNPAATPRPNLVDPASAEARFLLRRPLYRRLAHHIVDTSALASAAIVPLIVDLLLTQQRNLPQQPKISSPLHPTSR